jgi:hypothetical protein
VQRHPLGPSCRSGLIISFNRIAGNSHKHCTTKTSVDQPYEHSSIGAFWIRKYAGSPPEGFRSTRPSCLTFPSQHGHSSSRRPTWSWRQIRAIQTRPSRYQWIMPFFLSKSLTLSRRVRSRQGPSPNQSADIICTDCLQSSLVLRFVKDQFDDYRESTIGAAFLTQTISLDENTTVKFEIWDTAGQERYKSLAPM